jgi:hypothetical protein
MNRPAYEDKRDASVRRYLLRALRKCKLSGLQWDILAYIIEETYGWEDPDRKARGQKCLPRKDRNDFWYQEIAEEVEATWDAVSRAMRKLITMQILTEYSVASKIAPGCYGINSDPSTWIIPPRDRSAKLPTQKAPIRRPNCRPNTVFGRLKSVDFSDKLPTNVAEKADNQAVCEAPNLDNLDKDPPVVPQGTDHDGTDSEVLSGDPGYTLIETAAKALERQDMSIDEVMWQAEKHYSRRFVRDLDASKGEPRKLRSYFESSRFRGSLLSFWIGAMTPVFDARQLAKRQPQEQRYVPRSPFRDCLDRVQDVVAERKREAEIRSEQARGAGPLDPSQRGEARGQPTPRPPLAFRDHRDQRKETA